ncbi:hypothetical protein KGY79_13465 [Candidatus Bipolaricaulota bacterium]|nr:hypothetical protein [Candidatus Bipolaricaulota bacterium]
MKVEYNPIEKMQLVSIIKGYKETLKVYREQGLDEQAGFDLSRVEKMADYHINKLRQDKQEVELDQLE